MSTTRDMQLFFNLLNNAEKIYMQPYDLYFHRKQHLDFFVFPNYIFTTIYSNNPDTTVAHLIVYDGDSDSDIIYKLQYLVDNVRVLQSMEVIKTPFILAQTPVRERPVFKRSDIRRIKTK